MKFMSLLIDNFTKNIENLFVFLKVMKSDQGIL